ncbi:MAG: YvrJ family protein [Firmicutes bacterium]|nr:YvrJ family protein [Bacillota bacterium]
MQEIAELIQRVGFPVFVATYVLMRLEPAIHNLNKSVRLLMILVARQQGTTVEEIERQFGNGKR